MTIADNLDVTRLQEITERDRERLERYLAARAWIQSLDGTVQQ